MADNQIIDITFQAGGVTSAVTVDAVISEQHQLSNEVTDFPVEQGADITDHVRPKPKVLTIEGVVTATPLPAADETPIDDPGLVDAAYKTLESLSDQGIPLTLLTRLKVYENVVFQSITVHRNAKTGEALRFNAVLKEIILVASQVVELAAPKAKKKKALGQKGIVAQTTPTPAPATTPLTALGIAFGVLDPATGFVPPKIPETP